MKTFHGAPSHHLATPELDLHVTVRGGHMAPVVFHLPGRDVSPYSLSPWRPGEFAEQPVLLDVLRGDFLCLPFGPQDDGPPHGDPANAEWSLAARDERSLTLRQQSGDSGADIEKILTVRPSHHAVYAEHRISKLAGEFNYGTHPVLDLSALPEGSARVSVSPFRWASVFPTWFSNPENGESQALACGATFSDLREVPLAAGGTTDLTRYPARAGNDDLVMMANERPTAAQPFAWSAVVLDGYVWFSLKDPIDFPSTLFWMSNGGRPTAPWNSRHTGRLGVEEVCSSFCHGIAESRQNPLAAHGIPCTRHFTPDETVSLRVIHAVAAVPSHFGLVTRIAPVGPDLVAITGESGEEITVPCDWNFVL